MNLLHDRRARQLIEVTRARIESGDSIDLVLRDALSWCRENDLAIEMRTLALLVARRGLGLSIAECKHAVAHWPGFPHAPPGPELDAFVRPLIAGARARRSEPGVPPAPRTADEALAWLATQGASRWLILHHELVVETADELTVALGRDLMLAFDRPQVLLGAAIHDAGKIEHPDEMHGPGHRHEHAGENALLEAGFDPVTARACVTHATWDDPRATLEDRLVALADKLWKGKRDEALERALLEEMATATGRERWDVFERFDAICERIAARGPERLSRSRV